LNKAVKLLSILINTLWTHRCSAFTKDLPNIKIRVAHLFSVLCYKSNKKQKMGTYAVNIYGWLMCKLTVTQRTIESTNIKIRVAHLFSVLCSPIMCLYVWVSCCDFRIQTMICSFFTSTLFVRGQQDDIYLTFNVLMSINDREYWSGSTKWTIHINWININKYALNS
jgi:hypothetical protein